MMKTTPTCYPALAILLAALLPAGADEVTLKSGTVIQGQIMSETQYEVRVEVARNRTGTVRTIQVIDRGEVVTMSRGSASINIVEDGAPINMPATGSQEEEPETEEAANKLDLDKVQRWLEQTDGMLSEGRYDEALARFQTVSGNDKLRAAYEGQSTPEAVEALKLRIQAYTMWVIALEGKAEHLAEYQDNFEEKVKDNLQRAERKLKELERNRDRKEESDSSKKISMRSRNYARGFVPGVDSGDSAEDLAKDVAYWEAQRDQFETWSANNELEITHIKSEVELIEEKVDRLEDDLSTMEKSLQRR